MGLLVWVSCPFHFTVWRIADLRMKVGLCIRGDVLIRPGGDWNHLREISSGLRALGCDVEEIVSTLELNSSFDSFILFNSTRITDSFQYAKQIRKLKKPYFLIPIWHSVREMTTFHKMHWRTPFFPYWGYAGIREIYYSLRSWRSFDFRCSFGYRKAVVEVVENARAIFPNSVSEWEAMKSEIGVNNCNVEVIPCGVDAVEGGSTQLRKDILCVGRIEPRKNQNRVIEAFLESRIDKHRLKIIGAMSRSHRRYTSRFVDLEMNPLVEYCGEIPHQELMQLMTSSKGLILGSYFETTGLVVMEALIRGVKVAMTDSPLARELYGGSVSFFNPYEKSSISNALLEVGSDDYSFVEWKGCSWNNVCKRILDTIKKNLSHY